MATKNWTFNVTVFKSYDVSMGSISPYTNTVID